jgi:hypothetical protein
MTQRRLETAASLFAHTGNWIVPVDPLTASALAGRPVNQSALYFPRARAIDMSALCTQLLRHPLIDYRCGVDVTALQTLPDNARLVTTPAFSIRIRLSCVTLHRLTTSSRRAIWNSWRCGSNRSIELDQPPDIPLLGDANLVPLRGGWSTGSTYEHRPWTPEHASAANLEIQRLVA